MNVELYIDKLVLDGFARDDRYHIGTAIERELTQLFAEQGMPPSLTRGGEVANLDGGAFELVSDSKSQIIGAQVAQAVYEGLR